MTIIGYDQTSSLTPRLRPSQAPPVVKVSLESLCPNHHRSSECLERVESLEVPGPLV